MTIKEQDIPRLTKLHTQIWSLLAVSTTARSAEYILNHACLARNIEEVTGVLQHMINKGQALKNPAINNNPATFTLKDHEKERQFLMDNAVELMEIPRTIAKIADYFGMDEANARKVVRHLREDRRIYFFGRDGKAGQFAAMEVKGEPTEEDGKKSLPGPDDTDSESPDTAGDNGSAADEVMEGLEFDGIHNADPPGAMQEEVDVPATTEKISLEVPRNGLLASYLDALVAEGGYGETRAEALHRLAWDGIFESVSKGWIDKIEVPK